MGAAEKLWKPVERELRDYQQELVERFLESTRQRSLIVLPTGAGKTVVAVEIARSYTSVLVVAHLRELVTQAYDRLIEAGAEAKSVGVVMAGDERLNRKARIQVGSIQTLARRKSKLKLNPALIIIDEAHRAAAKTYIELVRLFPKARVLGLTATPIRFDGKGLAEHFDEIIEGPTPEALIEGGWIVRPAIWTAPVDKRPNTKGVRKEAGDYEQGELAKRANTAVLTGDIVRDWKEKANNKLTMVFAVNIEHSKAIVERFREAKIKAEHVDGSMSPDCRAEILTRFKQGRVTVVSSCSVFGEGFDAPWVRCLVFARPTLSLSLYLQQCGRGMRPGTEPVFLDHAGNALKFGSPEAWCGWELAPTDKAKHAGGFRLGKECPDCGRTYGWAQIKCVECGHEWEERERQHPVEDLEQLQRLNERRPIGPFASIDEAARATGIARETIRGRISKGHDPFAPLRRSLGEGLKPLYKEMLASRGEAAVSVDAFVHRVRKGMTPEDAFTVEPRPLKRAYEQVKTEAKRHGVSRGTFTRRLQDGWTPNAAANTPPNAKCSHPGIRVAVRYGAVTLGGVTYKSMSSLAKTLGISGPSLRQRIANGAALEDAVEAMLQRKAPKPPKPPKPPRPVWSYMGETYASLDALAAKHGLWRHSLRRSIRRGCSLDEAIAQATPPDTAIIIAGIQYASISAAVKALGIVEATVRRLAKGEMAKTRCGLCGDLGHSRTTHNVFVRSK
jgi:DNA repair protein RadD